MTDPDFYQQPTKPAATPDETASFQPPIPSEIGPYKIEALLEKGGMSLLFLGSRPDDQKPTIVKVLLPKFISNPDIVERFLKEAEIIAIADHPNIVKLYGHGKWEGGLYIAMEFVQGISLRQYILQTPISLKHALEIITDIAYALCHLHTHGVIHRDLKPENILVTESGSIKVIDFGIAQVLTDFSSEIPKHQRVIGTPIYMSPEQRENPESVSFPADIYSLGIIAYELILGRLSHGQIHLSLMPKGMQKILMKALQPEVKDRYQDIVDFIVAISGYLNSEAFEKDKVVKDHLSELSESLKKTQVLLNQNTEPQWENVRIKINTLASQSIAGVYHDFLEISPGVYGVCFAESSIKGSGGLFVCTNFRGLLRALYKRTSNLTDLVNSLNRSLIEDGLDKAFNFNYLVLDTQLHEVRYLLCGQSYLWSKPNQKTPYKVLCENPPLGEDMNAQFQIQQVEWKEQDSYILSNIGREVSESELLEIWESSERLNPQIWMEIFLRKYKLIHKLPPEKPISFISLQF